MLNGGSGDPELVGTGGRGYPEEVGLGGSGEPEVVAGAARAAPRSVERAMNFCIVKDIPWGLTFPYR